MAANAGRKRKHDEVLDAITILPCPSADFETALKLTPIITVQKYEIPFHWLSGTKSRHFRGSLIISRPDEVLITKTDGDRGLYAIELAAPGIYGLSRLSKDVKLKEIRRLTKSRLAYSESSHDFIDFPKEENWWLQLREPLMTHANIMLTPTRLVLSRSNDQAYGDVKNLKPKALDTVTGPMVQESRGDLKQQYLNFLFLSRSSLAYFAKSTLARARTEAVDVTLHIQVLKSLLLPIDGLERKYRETIPRYVQAIDRASIELDAVEITFVKKWLSKIAEMNSIGLPPKIDNDIDALKLRETHLQVILLLEVVALSSKMKEHDGQASCLESALKAEVHLDLLIDRLCIRQLLGTLVDVDTDVSQQALGNEEDSLKQFCREVVSPLYIASLPLLISSYAASLPKQCRHILEKCGVLHEKRFSRKLSRAKSERLPRQRSNSADSLVSLMSIDHSRGKTAVEISRVGMANSKLLQKREVALPARQKFLKEQLSDAIKGIVKPHRVEHAAEFMDAARARSLVKNRSKTRTKLFAPQLIQGIQRTTSLREVEVSATPTKRSGSPALLQTQPNLSPHRPVASKPRVDLVMRESPMKGGSILVNVTPEKNPFLQENVNLADKLEDKVLPEPEPDLYASLGWD